MPALPTPRTPDDWSPDGNPTVRTLLAVGANRAVGARYRRRLERAFGALHLEREFCEATAMRIAQGIWLDEWRAQRPGRAGPPEVEWIPNATHLVGCLTLPHGGEDGDEAAPEAARGFTLVPEAGVWIRPIMAVPHRMARLTPALTVALRLARRLGGFG